MRVYVEKDDEFWSYSPEDFLDQLERWDERKDIEIDEDLARDLATQPGPVYGPEGFYGVSAPHFLFRPMNWIGDDEETGDWFDNRINYARRKVRRGSDPDFNGPIDSISRDDFEGDDD